MFSEWRLFQKVASGVLVVFMGLLVLVTVVAHTRPSGSTRQDMAQAQLLRKQVESNPKTTHHSAIAER